MTRRWGARAAWVLVVLLAAAGGLWAGRATFAPPSVPEADSTVPLYTVREETVGNSMSFPVAARWDKAPLGTGAATGTVTSLEVAEGDTVAAGDVLYTVDLRPVVVMSGTVPAFRDLAEGAEGADVRQLQEFLRDAGYLEVRTPDGEFGVATTTAVKTWQKRAGVEQDGVVRAGDVVFASPLPARVVLDEAVTVGAQLAPGQPVVSSLGLTPTFVMELAVDQAQVVPTSGPVSVTGTDVTWDGVIASATTTSDGLLVLTLTAHDGGPLCGTGCGGVPVAEKDALFTGNIITVEASTGPTVPAAAVGTLANGDAFVVAEDGTQVPVTIRSQGNGRAVVDGIAVGDAVRLFGEKNPADARDTASTSGSSVPEDSAATDGSAP
ncbi:peptidoglycan-binding protein [Oerskovia enterophila]|uniref:Peptidoglycan binding domain protein n=1 Tax=Oerskovia enterophila TaxID=43678 RepID=A0A163PW51_9CELL|nr:peptidoglycan-binding protein [Oerskovia enterophila]KZM33566.1 putative peptidoglycan binding domain protein [Oerskovia enterophila]OCI29742.1 putative peptidoglycan binding domain protein [Oerskovia enterophila]